MRAVRDARDLVAAMHEWPCARPAGTLTEPDQEAMRAANSRFRSAIEQGDVEAALRADDELHGVLVAAAANRALTAVHPTHQPAATRLRLASAANPRLACDSITPVPAETPASHVAPVAANPAPNEAGFAGTSWIVGSS